jgi:predicted RNase H-like HicB family nuclease
MSYYRPVPLSSLRLVVYNLGMARRSDPFTVIVEQDDEGYFVANVPELRGCHTQAKSLDVLMKRVAEAITLCLAENPRPARRRFVGVQQIQVA